MNTSRAIQAFSALMVATAMLAAGATHGALASSAVSDSAETAEWTAGGGDWRGQYYSPLTRINAANVGTLGLAWQYDATPSRGGVPRGLEATAVMVNGVLYASLAWSEVVALDAATGRQLWRYDPRADGASDRKACCDVVSRGVAVWKGRVYVATTDGYLVALDARSGHLQWRVDTFVDRTHSYTITGAPQVAGQVVVIGNSGAEFGVRGYVSAYDLRTGAFMWRFYTVPGDPRRGLRQPEMKWAARTWDPRSRYWLTGGGGPVWGTMTYDPHLNLLYFGTGNGTPYPAWFRSPARGANLFVASILALDPDTGRLKWYYQETPGEIWDYDATQSLVLADLPAGGHTRKVLMQASKNGFFYILDRTDGRLLSAQKFVYVNWAARVDLKSGRPVPTGEGWYQNEPKLVFPGQAGGHNWMPMSYSRQTGLVYIPAIDTPMLFTTAPAYHYRAGEFNMGADGDFPPIPEQFQDPRHPARMRERLVAWDPGAQRERWRVPLGGFFNGGVLSTAGGLVFQGTSGGHFVAYDARTGRVLRDIAVGTGIMAAPASYSVRGKQYVVVLAGYGGAMLKMFAAGVAAREYQNGPRILAFTLNGAPVPLPPRVIVPPLPAQPYAVHADERTLARGKELYLRHCARCHGGYWEGAPSGYPDLKRIPPGVYAGFTQIVLRGSLRREGMSGFADVLRKADVQAIAEYLKTETNRLIASGRTRPGSGGAAASH